MEDLPVDILMLIALDMETPEILQLCRTSTKLNQSICNNPNFWRNKIIKDFKINFGPKDVKTLKEYYILLSRAYSMGYWVDSYLIALDNNYQDLVKFLKSRDFWGVVNDKGQFRIMIRPSELNLNRLLDTRSIKNSGMLCNILTRYYIIYSLKQLETEVDLTKYNNIELCRLLYNELNKKGLIYPDRIKRPNLR